MASMVSVVVSTEKSVVLSLKIRVRYRIMQTVYSTLEFFLTSITADDIECAQSMILCFDITEVFQPYY